MSRYIIIVSAMLLAGCFREQPQTRRSPPETVTNRPSGVVARPAETTDPATTTQSRKAAAGDTLEGTIYISGNVPFTRLTLALDGKKSVTLDIDSVRMKELWKIQGQRIRVTGRIVKGLMKNAVIVREYKRLEE